MKFSSSQDNMLPALSDCVWFGCHSVSLHSHFTTFGTKFVRKQPPVFLLFATLSICRDIYVCIHILLQYYFVLLTDGDLVPVPLFMEGRCSMQFYLVHFSSVNMLIHRYHTSITLPGVDPGHRHHTSITLPGVDPGHRHHTSITLPRWIQVL